MTSSTQKGRVVALDYGLKRIGVAISDENRILATSLGVILAGKTLEDTIHEILRFLSPYTITKLIIGNPLHLDGKKSLLGELVSQFMALLAQHVPYPVTLWDERLSTAQADRALREGGWNRKERSQRVDALAAQILLQSFLGY